LQGALSRSGGLEPRGAPRDFVPRRGAAALWSDGRRYPPSRARSHATNVGRSYRVLRRQRDPVGSALADHLRSRPEVRGSGTYEDSPSTRRARSPAWHLGRSGDVDYGDRGVRSTQAEARLQPAGSRAFDSARRFSRRRFRARAATSVSSRRYCRKCSGCAAIRTSGKSDLRSTSAEDSAISNWRTYVNGSIPCRLAPARTLIKIAAVSPPGRSRKTSSSSYYVEISISARTGCSPGVTRGRRRPRC